MSTSIRSGDAAVVIDAAGKILSWNQAAVELLGYTAHEVIGRPCAEVFCGEDLFGNVYCHEHCTPRVMSAGCQDIRPFEANLRNAAGEFLRIRVSSVCICTEDASKDLIVHVLGRASSHEGGAEEAGVSSEVSLMVTDMVGSTETLEHAGESRALELIHEHNALVRGSLKTYRGSEVQHTGDGMIASFDSPASAAHCACAVQQDCARYNQRSLGEALQLRIGLHSGRLRREEKRWFGTAMNEAARICAYASGGEILISDYMARKFETNGLRLKDRGEVKLRGISQPVHLHELDWRSSTSE